MKAITIWQPWASLIAHGYKAIETRTHGRFAGLVGRRIAIHAGMRYDPRTWAGTWGVPYYIRHRSPRDRYQIRDICYDCPKLPRGAVVCTAVVLEHRRLSDTDSTAALCLTDERLYGLILDVDSIERFVPEIPAKGHQGIWEWSGGVQSSECRMQSERKG